MKSAHEAALTILRTEATRLSGHRTDRVFLADHLDRLEAWMDELERQYLDRQNPLSTEVDHG